MSFLWRDKANRGGRKEEKEAHSSQAHTHNGAGSVPNGITLLTSASPVGQRKYRYTRSVKRGRARASVCVGNVSKVSAARVAP